MQKLAYIANIRLPTEKAHGFQICKMCESFALQNTAVSLYHPHRQQTPTLASKTAQDAFDYYGIQPTFTIHTVPQTDFIAYENQLPGRLLRFLLNKSATRFAKRSANLATDNQNTLFYTRDFGVADHLTSQGLPTILEAHSVPKGRDYAKLAAVVKRPSFQFGVVLTQFIRQALIKAGASPNKVIVEPDAVDLAQYANLPSPGVAKQQLNLPLNRPIIGYIGRFKTMGMDKGIHFLLNMMAHLPKEMDAEPLLLCVGGPLDDVAQYVKVAKSLDVPNGRLQFVGRVPNTAVPLWMQAIDIATMPYPFTEHYAYYMSPMKLFEYLAAGKAIVSTDLPSIQEIITDGQNGLLFPHDNPQAFAHGILHLLTDDARKQQLETKAKQDVQKYSWTARAKRILEAVDG